MYQLAGAHQGGPYEQAWAQLVRGDVVGAVLALEDIVRTAHDLGPATERKLRLAALVAKRVRRYAEDVTRITGAAPTGYLRVDTAGEAVPQQLVGGDSAAVATEAARPAAAVPAAVWDLIRTSAQPPAAAAAPGSPAAAAGPGGVSPTDGTPSPHSRSALVFQQTPAAGAMGAAHSDLESSQAEAEKS